MDSRAQPSSTDRFPLFRLNAQNLKGVATHELATPARRQLKNWVHHCRLPESVFVCCSDLGLLSFLVGFFVDAMDRLLPPNAPWGVRELICKPEAMCPAGRIAADLLWDLRTIANRRRRAEFGNTNALNKSATH
jgi:hypothetical protein